MGGTIILWQALRGGQIDLYPEYTGTIGEEILKTKERLSEEAMREALEKFGVGMSSDLGFNNTYALVMRRAEAERLGIHTISDLRRHPELKIGLTHEFLDRQDGWRPLVARYGLTMPNVSGIDHAIGYAALAQRLDRRQGCLFDRREDPGERSGRAARRPPLFPRIQSGFSLPPQARPARDQRAQSLSSASTRQR